MKGRNRQGKSGENAVSCPVDIERGVCSVKKTQSFFQIDDSCVERCFWVGFHPFTTVFDDNSQLFSPDTGRYVDTQWERAGLLSVFQGVFEQGENEKGWHEAGGCERFRINFVLELFFKANFLDLEVVFQGGEFFGEGFEFLAGLKGEAEEISEGLCDIADFFVVFCFRDDGVQGVKEEMRVDLGAQNFHFRGAVGLSERTVMEGLLRHEIDKSPGNQGDPAQEEEADEKSGGMVSGGKQAHGAQNKNAPIIIESCQGKRASDDDAGEKQRRGLDAGQAFAKRTHG